MTLIVDSWVWIEIASGGPKSKFCLEKLRGQKLYTTILNLYEVFYSLKRVDKEDKVLAFIESIKNTTEVIYIDERLAYEAGDLHLYEGLSAIDSFVYSTAIRFGGDVLTGDPHFKGKKRVIFIE